MRKTLWMVVAAAAAASMLWAGEPPGGEAGGPPGRDRRGGPPGGDPRGGPGGRFNPFFGQMTGRRRAPDLFDTARRYFDLTEEQQATVEKLHDQYGAEERAAEVELRKGLDKRFLTLIAEVLPAEEKARFEKLFAAMTERDAAIAAAEKEFRTVLDKVETDQGIEDKAPPDYIPSGKADVIRRFIKLSEQQREDVDGIRRDGWGAMREKMRDVARPQNWRDAAARQRFFEAANKVREEVEGEFAETMAKLLNPEQKKAYDTAAAAYDACRTKVKEAEAAYEKALVDAVGEEKAKGVPANQPPQRTRF